MQYNETFYRDLAAFVKARLPFTPDVAVVLGSSLSAFADRLKDPVRLPYKEIPGFPVSTAPGHRGEFVCGTVGGHKVLCMSGRFHHYEGYSYETLAVPVRLMKLLGVRRLILTNAAGAVNTAYRVGDVMLLKDHIRLGFESPLTGENLALFGPRFFDVSSMYTAALRETAKAAAGSSPLTVHEGVYMYFAGPQFETPAEIRAARILGADVVGMSTAPEALAAAHCGMPLLAMSVITNMAAGVEPAATLSSEEVGRTAQKVGAAFADYLEAIVRAFENGKETTK